MSDDALDQYIARPRGLVFDSRRTPRGLLLPVVEDGADAHKLYSPVDRRREFPKATWEFLVHVATNVARAFAAVHATGLVVGDINAGSVLVRQDGTVRLIDVDSFQVPVPGGRPLLCTVAVPDFLPEELIGRRLDEVVRTRNHDAFGLAVLLFHLLLLGRHPHAGRYSGSGDMPIAQAIKEHRFAFGRNAARYGMERPRGTVSMSAFSPAVSELFERAFAPHEGQMRPSAEEWVTALSQLRSSLTICGRRASHHYFKGLLTCPWCEIEGTSTLVLFGDGTPQTKSTPTKPSVSLHDDFRSLTDLFKAMRAPAMAAAPGPPAPPRPSQASERSGRVRRASLVAAVLGTITVLSGLMAEGSTGLLISTLGVMLTGTASRARWKAGRVVHAAYRTAVRQHREAAVEFNRLEQHPQWAAASTSLHALMREWNELPRWRERRLGELRSQRMDAELRTQLQKRMIRPGLVRGVGAARVSTLAAHNIRTAWDVNRQRIEQIRGFGTTTADQLVAWRREVERVARSKTAIPLPPEVLRATEDEVTRRRKDILRRFRSGLTSATAARSVDASSLKAARDLLVTRQVELAQAEADAKKALGKLPAS